MLESVIMRCEEEFKARLSAMESKGSVTSMESLKKDLEDGSGGNAS
jgi:hypothetical protein